MFAQATVTSNLVTVADELEARPFKVAWLVTGS